MKRTMVALMLWGVFHSALGCGSDPETADPAADPSEPDMVMDAGQDAPEDEADTDEPPESPGCQNGYELPVTTGNVSEDDLTEISGIVPSAHDPGVLWVHNDSGDAARVVAITTRGEVLGEVRMPDPALDFEDIAAGMCPDGTGPCLWVGDVGDNAQARPFVSVYVFPEPEVDGSTPFEPVVLSDVTDFRFTYPDGAINSEGIVVLPDGSGLFIFEKVGGPTARVFTHTGALDDGSVPELALVATIDIPGLITGADLHPSGTRLLLRTYEATFEYVLEEGQTLKDLAEVTPSLVGGIHAEPQGEAVCYSGDGASFFTISEQRFQPLKQYRCAACDDGDVCTQGDTGEGAACSGELIEDEFESDAELDGAELPRLDFCPSSRSILARQGIEDTEDWYKIEHDADCAPYVRLVNFGADERQVCAWFQCDNGDTPDVDCFEGAQDGEPPEGTEGCCSSAPGQSTASIRMAVDCDQGDQEGTIHVRVVTEDPSGCGLYELTRGNF